MYSGKFRVDKLLKYWQRQEARPFSDVLRTNSHCALTNSNKFIVNDMQLKPFSFWFVSKPSSHTHSNALLELLAHTGTSRCSGWHQARTMILAPYTLRRKTEQNHDN